MMRTVYGFVVLGILALGLAACADRTSPLPEMQIAETNAGAVAFIVIGDTPYGDEDKDMLARALPLVKEMTPPFVIHLGDYKGGGAECTADHDEAQRALVDALKPIPVFYTPGDNEWTDCDRFERADTGVRYSDLDRLDQIRQLHFSDPPEAWNARHQRTLPENAAWETDGIAFMTLHVVGTNNGRDWVTGDPLERAKNAVAKRDEANLAWLKQNFDRAISDSAKAVVIAMQADMTDIASKPEGEMCTSVATNDDHPCDGFADLRNAIRTRAEAYGGPVLLIHGDTAPFTLNQDVMSASAENLWRLNAAGDAGIGRTGFPYGKRDITVVSVDPKSQPVFKARGLLSGDVPKRK